MGQDKKETEHVMNGSSQSEEVATAFDFTSNEKLPESWPEEFPGITKFAPVEPAASVQFDNGDLNLVNNLGNLAPGALIDELKAMHAIACRLAIEEEREKTRGKILRSDEMALMMDHMRHLQIGATKSMFDELIDRHAEAYSEAYPEVKEFGNFERSGTGNCYIGMVWTRENEKPDTAQLKLRGSLSLTNNKMVELDLSAIDSQQSFFPGQIIAFHADPFIKRRLTIRKLLDPVRIAPRLKTIATDNKINLLVAAGPFMRPDQEDWTLFDRIIDEIKQSEVTHAVLLGPFVDMENKVVKAKYDINWRIYLEKLVEGLVNHSCDVYLVPSGRDVLPHYLNATYFYPSKSLEFELRVKENIVPRCKIRSVGDPAQIDLGGLYLDVTSAEVLFHLNKCSSFVNKGGSTFTTIYRHLITHGIYPIYPPPADMAVDYPKLTKHIQLDRLGPHILVLPSRFSTSVSNVDDRCVIAVQKCSTKKQVVLLQIPKIDSSNEPLNSIMGTDFKHKTIDLLPRNEESGSADSQNHTPSPATRQSALVES